MRIGNEFYITEFYDEDKFKIVLEYQLSYRKGTQLDNSLIEQAISAMLSCEENNLATAEVSFMKNNLYLMNIDYKDFRKDYSIDSEISGNPEDAVKTFNHIVFDLNETISKWNLFCSIKLEHNQYQFMFYAFKKKNS